MDLTYFGRLRVLKWVPGPKISFLRQFCQPYCHCWKNLKFSKFYPNHIVALHWSMFWLFHWYKNKEKLVRDCTRKTELSKIFFCILIREKSLNILYKRKQIPIFQVSLSRTHLQFINGSRKWIPKYQYCRKSTRRPFSFPICRLAYGYVYIKCNFCNYKFCSSRFSKISLLKFAPKLQSHISNDLQNLLLQNLSFMFHANLFQLIFIIWSQPERGVIYM